MTIDQALEQLPIVAIVRGVTPDEVIAIGEALYAQGVRAMEVPLNSPEPLESIRRLAIRFKDQMMVGAGTVLSLADVDAIKAAGGQFIVSPNVNRDVILRSLELGLEALPGFMTPTEAFAAIDAGARFLKLFPAATLGSGYLKAIGAVLPRHVKVIAVGGIGPSAMAEWQGAGASGFGLGSPVRSFDFHTRGSARSIVLFAFGHFFAASTTSHGCLKLFRRNAELFQHGSQLLNVAATRTSTFSAGHGVSHGSFFGTSFGTHVHFKFANVDGILRRHL